MPARSIEQARLEGKNTDGRQTLVLIDEAQWISLTTMHDVLALSESCQFRLVIAGDKERLQAPGESAAFELLLKTNPSTISLTKTRQEFQLTEDSNIKIVAHDSEEARYQALAEYYVEQGQTANDVLALVPNRDIQITVNKAIHHQLQQEGWLSQSEESIAVFVPVSLAKAQYSQAKHYQVGNTLRFNRDNSQLGIARGEYALIKAINHRDNSLGLQKSSGEMVDWLLNKSISSNSIEIYEPQTRSLAIDEQLVCTRGFRQHIKKGEQVTLIAINDTNLIVTHNNGRQIQLARDNPAMMHIDYAYAQTPMAAHHKKVDTLLAVLPAYHPTCSQRTLAQYKRQANKKLVIFTDDKAELEQRLQSHSGNRDIAIDTVLATQKQSPTYDSQLHHHIKQTIASLTQSYGLTEKHIDNIAEEAVSYAIAHLSEREAAFKHEALMETALSHALGNIRPHTLEQTITSFRQQDKLLSKANASPWYTTKEARNIEQEILTTALALRQQRQPFMSKATATEWLKASVLKSEQQRAALTLLTTRDGIVLIQGYPGTGKTTLLDVSQTLLHTFGREDEKSAKMLALAPTHAAVKAINAQGIAAQTLDSFLIASQQTNNTTESTTPTVIVLDESSMASNKKFHQLLSIVNANPKLRLCAIGDKQQIAAIEAGKPFALLQQAGLTTIVLKDIRRQKNPALLQTVHDVIDKRHDQAFERLAEQEHIIEGENRSWLIEEADEDKRYTLLSNWYLSKTPEEREQALAITPAHEDRLIVNHLIRQGLQKQGVLQGKVLTTNILAATNRTETEKARAKNFAVGEVVRFGFSMKPLGIESGDYCSVTAVYSERNLLLLKTANNKTIPWHPTVNSNTERTGIEVYQRQQRELQQGDLIRWTRSDKTRQLLSAETATVLAIQGDGIKLKRNDNQVITLNIQQHSNQHWDYAYAGTAFFVQGKTSREAAVLLLSYRKILTNQQNLLVSLSRATHQALIITDDKEKLLDRIERNNGEKRSSLEILDALPKTSSPTTNSPLITNKNYRRTNKDFNAVIKKHEHIGLQQVLLKEAYSNEKHRIQGQITDNGLSKVTQHSIEPSHLLSNKAISPLVNGATRRQLMDKFRQTPGSHLQQDRELP